MLWEIATDRALCKYFCGENVWSKKWEKVSSVEVAHVFAFGNEVEMAIWQVSFGGSDKIFAAKEMSNGNWCFAIPLSDGNEANFHAECAVMDKVENLKVVANNFRNLLIKYEGRDPDAFRLLSWLAPLFVRIAAGDVTPPIRYEFRMALGKDSPFYDPGGPFSRAEADFVCALEDWVSQPWYKG